MKSSHKKSNRMLIGAGIFLVVYLLASVIFGSFLIDRFSTQTTPNRSVTHVTVWRNW
ncbi:MAG: hypothetical protein PWP25_1035 [Sphaerochaeta sp.]|jgi:hypothetical protein|nr:hypothetical protein [Sphaerochaeta sp.]